jgi:hypothetical protein
MLVFDERRNLGGMTRGIRASYGAASAHTKSRDSAEEGSREAGS